MTSLELDPRFTFESFVIGAANRLASAAARRVAESPGATYNPLFIYSASGLGKTHLVTAVGHYARRIHPDLKILYDTLEHFMEEVTSSIGAGDRDAFRGRFREPVLLILDDVQFLAGRHRTQEELIRAWDSLSMQGGQVVLASDRPPPEIDGLDERLLSRFSGGLIVDIGAPDYETRVAITRRKAEEGGHTLADGVAEALAKTAFSNVRELQGALNRLIAVQELEGRAVSAEEVPQLLGQTAAAAGPATGEFADFVDEIAGMVSEVVSRSPAERQLADAILRWEGEGYRTRRLETALADIGEVEDTEELIRQFEADVDRLREIAGEIAALEPGAPALSRTDVLRDPDRREDAETILGEVRERARPLPGPPAGVSFLTIRLPSDLFAVRAAQAVAETPGTRYNPLFVYGPPGSGKSTLLAAIGNALIDRDDEFAVAFVEGPAFAAELIEALKRNRAESWRERYRRAQIFLLDDLDALSGTERAQEELFHLFETLQRAGAQLAFAAAGPPRELDGIEDRLRTRLESGLVVELPEPREPDAATADGQNGDATRAFAPDLAAVDSPAGAVAAAGPGTSRGEDPWFRARDKVLWEWPYLEDSLLEGLE